MSKADEMFEKLGYEGSKVDNSLGYINEKGTEFILFINEIEEPKRICIHRDNTEYPAMSIQELQAIYEFCKERGWLDVK